MAPDLLEQPVHKIMGGEPKTIGQDDLAVQGVNIMTKTPGQYITSLIVTDEKNHIQGLIRLQDCLQAGVD